MILINIIDCYKTDERSDEIKNECTNDTRFI